MNTPDSEQHPEMDLRGWVRSIEAQNKRLRRLAWISLAVAIFALFVALRRPRRSPVPPILGDSVVATRFIVNDAAGNVRGFFGIQANSDNICFFINDQRGKSRFSMNLDSRTDTPMVILTDRIGKPRFIFTVPDDGPNAVFLDSAGKPITTLP